LKELRIEGGQREPGGGMPRWAWAAIAVVAAIALAAGAAWWFVASRPIAVQTAEAASAARAGASAGAVLQATGYVTARRRATVSSQITGTLTEVLFEEGDHVAKGQVLARLDDGALRAALAAAQAAAESAQAQVAQAQAQLVQARADERRQAELAASGMVTRQAEETARTTVALDAAQLEARRREADQARAQLTQARVNFDYAVVRAPFAGVVTDKAAQVGEIVSPLSAGGGFTRTGVGTIVDMDSLEVEVDVAEAYIGQVQAGMRCEAVLDAYPDWKIPAHVIAVIPEADRGKATVKVRVGLEQKDARLVPDIGVRVSFLASKQPAAPASSHGVLVPPSALAERDGATVVFVVRDGRAHAQRIPGGVRDAGALKLVPDGLEAGDRVVVSPPAELVDGAAVKPADEAAAH
jgi:RND family efflux transporter MFP subunit